MRVRLSAILLLLLFACGPSGRGGQGPEPVLPETAAGEADSTEIAPETEPSETGAPTIPRGELIAVLDAGPGAFLAGIEMKPYFDEQRFHGWEIVRFWPGDPRYETADVRPGDVVQAVNEQPIMKPEQLFEIWSSLRSADRLVITGLRAGEPFELRYDIVGDGADNGGPPAPSRPQK